MTQMLKRVLPNVLPLMVRLDHVINWSTTVILTAPVASSENVTEIFADLIVAHRCDVT